MDEQKQIDHKRLNRSDHTPECGRNYNNNNTFTILHSIVRSIVESDLLWSITTTLRSNQQRDVLRYILDYKYFTEIMAIVETNISQQTVNKILRKWVKVGFLKRKRDNINYKIDKKAFPFYIYWWSHLPEPRGQATITLVHFQRNINVQLWASYSPENKLFSWINNAYTYLSKEITTSGRTIPRTSDEQRKRIWVKVDKYNIQNAAVFELLTPNNFIDFKDFRKELYKLINGKELEPIKREKKTLITFVCLDCNKTFARERKPAICPYPNCESQTIKIYEVVALLYKCNKCNHIFMDSNYPKQCPNKKCKQTKCFVQYRDSNLNEGY